MARPRKSYAWLPKHIRFHHGTFWYHPPGGGERIRVGTQEYEVWKFMLEFKGDPEPPIVVGTLRYYFDRYKREVVPSLMPRTQKDYSRHIAVLDHRFGHMKPDDLKPKHIGQFLDRERGKIQANRQVAVLSAIYAKMVGRWYVAERNPCIGVERNPSKRRDRYVTDAEYAALYALCTPRIKIAMDLALLTGQRQGDLITLPWANVTDEGILFRQGKTGKRLLVAHSEALQAVLARAKTLTPVADIGGYVLHTRSGKPYTSEGFRACWQRTMAKAIRKGALKERFTFHDLRAKSVSDATTIQDAFERAGHTSMAMTRGVYDRGVRKVKPLK